MAGVQIYDMEQRKEPYKTGTLRMAINSPDDQWNEHKESNEVLDDVSLVACFVIAAVNSGSQLQAAIDRKILGFLDYRVDRTPTACPSPPFEFAQIHILENSTFDRPTFVSFLSNPFWHGIAQGDGSIKLPTFQEMRRGRENKADCKVIKPGTTSRKCNFCCLIVFGLHGK